MILLHHSIQQIHLQRIGRINVHVLFQIVLHVVQRPRPDSLPVIIVIVLPSRHYQSASVSQANGSTLVFAHVRAAPRRVSIGLSKFLVVNESTIDELRVLLLASDEFYAVRRRKGRE